MANRRCFSKDIVCSDDFYDLPISSQALYFHLGMQADDRGYVNNARSIIKIIGSSTGDLEALISKKFVLVRNNNLILIKGWRINNSIQPSKLVETKYTEDLKSLFFDENNSYTENNTNNPCRHFAGDTAELCRQYGDNSATQDNISKDKLSKDKLSKENIIKESEVSADTKKPSEKASNKGWTREKISQALNLKILKEECDYKLTDEEEQLLKEFNELKGE